MDVKAGDNWKKGWKDCVKDDMDKRAMSSEMTTDRALWKKKTYCAHSK